MGIVLTPFRWADDGDKLAFVHQLMEEAFPAAERRSRRDFEALLASEPRFLLRLIYRDEALVGFLSTWHLEGFYYGEHFAILPTERNRGIGREVLHSLKRGAALFLRSNLLSMSGVGDALPFTNQWECRCSHTPIYSPLMARIARLSPST